MESIATDPILEMTAAPADRQPPVAWDAAHSLVRRYLAAWRLGGEAWLDECSKEILGAARRRIAAGAQEEPAVAALAEAEAFISGWFGKLWTPSAENDAVPIQARVALLLGCSAESSPFADPAQLKAAFRQGTLNFERALLPARPPETRAITMQTNLSRLPSMRLIAGWFLLIALLCLGFLLTH